MSMASGEDVLMDPLSPAPRRAADSQSDAPVPVHVEVRLRSSATARFDTIRTQVHTFLTTFLSHLYLPSTLSGWEDLPVLSSSVELIRASESNPPLSSPSIPLERASLHIHVYQPSDQDAFEEFSSGGEEGGEEVMAASVCELPSRGWEGLWDSLIFEGDVKLKLLDYIYATVVFSDADIDFNIVSWNRVVLLHGPPGTGKTSLCRALAQKLSIRLSHRYPHARLLEINSHSLFSRWFSESGKLVQKLFASVMDMVEDEDTFVVVLIDEVESLTAARAGAMAGTEPSDALRVVNALLTQLDKLKHRKNVLVMSTSNLAKAIDSAFVDRADIVQYIDLPPREAIYEILRSCLLELIDKGIVQDVDVPTLTQAQLSFHYGGAPSTHEQTAERQRSRSEQVGLRLLEIAGKCKEQGMSGRSLRRLPVLAHARYIGFGVPGVPSQSRSPSVSTNGVNGAKKSGHKTVVPGIAVETWLDAMDKVVESHGVERGRFER